MHEIKITKKVKKGTKNKTINPFPSVGVAPTACKFTFCGLCSAQSSSLGAGETHLLLLPPPLTVRTSARYQQTDADSQRGTVCHHGAYLHQALPAPLLQEGDENPDGALKEPDFVGRGSEGNAAVLQDGAKRDKPGGGLRAWTSRILGDASKTGREGSAVACTSGSHSGEKRVRRSG